MEDQDLLLRTYATSTFACLDEVLLAYRENSLLIKRNLISQKKISYVPSGKVPQRRQVLDGSTGHARSTNSCTLGYGRAFDRSGLQTIAASGTTGAPPGNHPLGRNLAGSDARGP